MKNNNARLNRHAPTCNKDRLIKWIKERSFVRRLSSPLFKSMKSVITEKGLQYLICPDTLKAVCAEEKFSVEEFKSLLRVCDAIAKDSMNDFLIERALAAFLSEGPKIVAPTYNEFMAMAHVDANIGFFAYNQPFDTVMVVIPDEFKSDYHSICCNVWDQEENKVLIFTAIKDPGTDGNELYGQSALYWKDHSDKNIESILSKAEARQGRPEEFLTLQRVVINTCLYMTNYGAKRIGTASPSHEANLIIQLGKKTITDQEREDKKKELSNLPTYYGFNQSVKMYETEGISQSKSGEKSFIKPHWRRGHWRHQNYGKVNSMQKLVFIRPVLVNRELYSGKECDTQVTYKLGAM